MGDAQRGRLLLVSVGFVTAAAVYSALIAAKVISWVMMLADVRSNRQAPGPGA